MSNQTSCTVLLHAMRQVTLRQQIKNPFQLDTRTWQKYILARDPGILYQEKVGKISHRFSSKQ